MKTIKIFCYLFVFLLFYSCINRSGRINENDTEQDTVGAFSSIALDAIRESLGYILSNKPDINRDSILIHVIFGKTSNSSRCFLSISEMPFYFEEDNVAGYSYVDGYTVIFYNRSISCNNGSLVYLDKLIPFTDSISGFLDYYNSPHSQWDYRPYRVTYEVINSDSLVFLYDTLEGGRH